MYYHNINEYHENKYQDFILILFHHYLLNILTTHFYSYNINIIFQKHIIIIHTGTFHIIILISNQRTI